MSRISEHDIRAFERLSERHKLDLARNVAKRRSREFREKYPNVVSCGVGYRTTGDSPDGTGEVCLKFAVSKKWKRRLVRGVPAYILAFRTSRGNRKRYAIPTDVNEFAGGEPSGAMDLENGVIARAQFGGSGSTGAVFCLVRDKDVPVDLYLLGCHHVFTRSLSRNGCTPDDSTILVRRDDRDIHIGELAYWSKLVTARFFGMDLAAVRVRDKGAVSSMNAGATPVRVADVFETPVDYAIHTPRGPVRARFEAEQFDLSLKFTCGRTKRTVRFASVLKSRVLTEPGDSGSPLIGLDGTLYGMHFYRFSGFALAIPAHEIFTQNHLPFHMELVTDHDP